MSDKSVVIIGAGLGGLMCGALLSKEGFRVTVVEKNRKIGGGLQSYTKHGAIFDTGMHVFGGMHPGGTMRRVCDYLGITDQIEVLDLGLDYDTEVYVAEDASCYAFSLLRGRLGQTLGRYFPHAAESLDTLGSVARQMADSFSLFKLKPAAPFRVHVSDEAKMTADAMIEKHISDGKARAIVSMLNMLYGGTRGVTPALLHAMLTEIFADGACRIVGGYFKMAEALARCITDGGGNILTGTAVTAIDCAPDGVSKIVLADGGEIKADYYIADIPITAVLGMAQGTPPASRTYQEWLDSQEPSCSAMIINIKLRAGSFKFFNRMGYYLDSYNNAWTMNDACHIHRFIYSTPPAENQGEYAKTLNIVVPMEWSSFDKWENSTVGRRDKAYYLLKQEIYEMVMDHLSRVYPDVRGAVECVDLSSPLTIRDYTGSVCGSMCGLRKDVRNSVLFLPVTTRLPNLLLTGQNVNLHGFCGVTLTSVLTCEAIMGDGTLTNNINSR